MFRRKRKEFPPETFLPTKPRVFAILQLCMALSVFLWLLFDPFMGEHFRLKSHLLLVHNLIGEEGLIKKVEGKGMKEGAERLKRNRERFLELNEAQQQTLLQGEKELIQKVETGFQAKFVRGFYAFFVKTPFFTLAWIFFSIVISILALKKVEGAKEAAFLLPLIAVLYAYDNMKTPDWQNPEEKLFPTEEFLVDNYLKRPLSRSIDEQEKELRQAWGLYLVDRWSREAPSADPETYKQQQERGDWLLHHKRFEIRAQHHFSYMPLKDHLAIAVIYILWNFAFAFTINSKKVI